MNRKIVALISALFIMVTLPGCQLAHEDGDKDKSMDRLIGVYVTSEPVDLFDFESYMNDNWNFTGEEVRIEGDTEKYQGRMYASKIEEVNTGSGGEEHTVMQYVFKDLEGIGMYAPTITDSLSNDMTYIHSMTDDGFTDTSYHIKAGDNEDEIELSGTVYISPEALSDIIYINPVYQSEDESVYLVTGSGFSASSDYAEGQVYSQKLESKVTMNEHGESKSYSSIVEVSIATMNPTMSVCILQMDKDSNLIKKTEYKPDDIPSEFRPEDTTEYIVVENTKETYNKEKIIDRMLFSKNDEELWSFKKGENGIFVKTHTTILWE